MTEPQERYEVIFLPWAPLDWKVIGGELRIGKVVFRPFTPVLINDEQIRRFLTIYFNRFRDLYNCPVDTITVCHYDPENRGLLEPLPGEAQHEIVAVIDLLTFCAVWDELRRRIAYGCPPFPPPNSETFDWYTQPFGQNSLNDNPLIAFRTHGLLQVEEVEKLHFQKPLPAHSRGKIHPNFELLDLLGLLFTEQVKADLRERILRSLKWFRIANKQAQLVDMETQVVQIATAFETLLGLSQEKSKKRPFVGAIDKWVRAVAGSRAKVENRTDHKGNIIATTTAGCWAVDFYDLRNAIVHGDIFSKDRLFFPETLGDESRPFRPPQHDIASFVYGALLVHLLEEETHYIHPKAKEEEEPTDSDREILNDLYKDLAWGVEECLVRLGWVERNHTTVLARELREQLKLLGKEAEEVLSSQQLIEERARWRYQFAKEGHPKG